jgi:hypothetical protein
MSQLKVKVLNALRRGLANLREVNDGGNAAKVHQENLLKFLGNDDEILKFLNCNFLSFYKIEN